MNRPITATPQQAASSAQIPWLTFLFLATVFFVAQHDWFFSLTAGEGFGTTVDEFTARVDQGNILRRIVFFSLGGFAAFSFFLQKGRYRVKINGTLGWLILLFLSWALLSLTWSDDPAISFRRLVLLAMLCLGAFAVSQRFSLHDIVLWVFISSIIYLHIGLVAEVVLGRFHPLSVGYRFAGTLHPNSQGINCALLFFASFFLLRNEKRLRWFYIAIVCESFIFLFLTKSRTSLGFALLAPLLYWFMTLSLSRKGAVILCVIFVSCILLLFGSFVFPTFEHAITLGREDANTITLTGRIPLWNEMLGYIFKRPIQGYGYDCFWTSHHVAEIASEQDWAVTQGHSAYLDVSLGLGLIGGSLYVLIMMVGIRRTLIDHEVSDNADHAFFGIVLIFIILNGTLESIVIMTNQILFILMLILARFGFLSQPAAQER